MNISALSRRLTLPGLAFIACALAARPASAQTDFTFTVSNPNIVAPPGSTVTLNGTVTFTGPSTNVTLIFGPYLGNYVAADPDPNFLYFLGGPAPTTYTGSLYKLLFFPSDTPGSVASLPNSDLAVMDSSGTVSIPITMKVGAAAVPEPPAVIVLSLGGVGLGGLILVARRRGRAETGGRA